MIHSRNATRAATQARAGLEFRPKKIARVFFLREVEDRPGKEVCEIMNISPSNLWVMLHRARMALRTCLETKWFSRPDSEDAPGE